MTPNTKYEFNMIHNPGPLVDISKNIAFMKKSPATNFAGGKYNSLVLKQDTVLHRVTSQEKNYNSGWFSMDKPSSIVQARIDKAIKPQWIDPKTGELQGISFIDVLYTVKVPKGTTIYYGPVATQGGIYVGGQGFNQMQVFIPWETNGLELIEATKLLK